MGARGPTKTPTAVLKLTSPFRAKAREQTEPKPEPGRPTCPAWLSKDAKSCWRQTVPHLEKMRVLTKADRNALARYCEFWATWREAQEFLHEHGMTYAVDVDGHVMPANIPHVSPAGFKEYPQANLVVKLAGVLERLEKQFGLTPSARASLQVEPERELDDLSAFVGRKNA